MKIMKCNQLGGPESCDKEFHAENFEELAEQSKDHAMEMAKQNDEAHLEAMQKMRELMEDDPKALKEWMEEKEEEFNNLSENEE